MTEEYDRMQPKMMTLFRFGLDIFISLIIEHKTRINLKNFHCGERRGCYKMRFS